jgi:hypothetical protein
VGSSTLSALAQALQRSSADLISVLKISGFVETTVVSQRKATAEEIQALLQAWNLQADAAALEGQIEFVEVCIFFFSLLTVLSQCDGQDLFLVVD